MISLKTFKLSIVMTLVLISSLSANLVPEREPLTDAPQDYFIKGPLHTNPHQPAEAKLPILRSPELSTFVQAADSVGLPHLFQGTGPFTVFAPTNDAFKKLGKAKLDALLQPQNQDRLTDILLYHIVPGKFLARNLKTMRLQTINGKYLEIVVDKSGNITVNGIPVIKKDIVGPNGVAFEISSVLIPK